MLMFMKLGADFSRGAQVRESTTNFSRPTPPWNSRIDSGRHTLVANRAGFMQVCGYELSRMYLPRRLVNKPWSMHRTPTGGIMLMGSTR